MSQTVIIFGEQVIIAAEGTQGRTPRFERVEHVALTGYGDSFSRWKEGLEELKEKMEISRARIVLPDALCATKMAQLPFVKGRQLEEMAKREMEESFRSSIMDFSVMRAEKDGMELCLASVEESVLKQFQELLGAFGIEITGVTVPMEGYLRVLSGIRAYREKTAIFLFFESAGMTSILSQNGQCRYSTRSRIFSERGTLDFGTEIIRNISGILQFQTASKSGAVITDVYYAGCPEADFEVSLEGIAGMNLTAHALKPEQGIRLLRGEESKNWALYAGAMMSGVRKQRDISLELSAEESAGTEMAREFGRQMILPLVLLVAGLAATGVLVGVNFFKEKKIEDVKDWMVSDEVQSEYRKATGIEQQVNRLVNAIETIEYTEINLSTYPIVDTAVIQKIENAGGREIEITLQSYDTDTGVLSFEAVSGEVINIPDYILKLEDTGLFYAVDYTGYVFDESGYRLTLSCTVQGGEAE